MLYGHNKTILALRQLDINRENILHDAAQCEIKNAGFLAEGILRYFWSGEGGLLK
jgi:hypothetical protein